MTELISSLKPVLTSRRSELARSIRSQRSQLNAGECSHELIDQMQSMNLRDEAVTLLDSLNRTLVAVDAALLAMEGGCYGICAECGDPVAPRRLKAIPWASHCIQCQEMLDRRGYTRAAVPYWDEAA